MKKIIPGILAAFILFTASAANAGGGHNGNWSFSISWHNGHPSYHVNVGPNWQQVSHWRQHRKWRKRARHHRRHGYRHRHGHRYHHHAHHNKHHHHHGGHRKHR
ncbi:MAG: hypothetical protein ACPGSM_16275 [Thiolinea sp.]